VIFINIVPDQLLTCGGSDELCGSASLLSIQNYGTIEHGALCKAISEKISKDLGIPDRRLVIEFRDVKETEVGRHGTTLKELWAAEK